MLMNAFNNVNLAAACIVTSAGFARELGVAEDNWVYPLGGAGTRDSYDCKCCASNHILSPAPSLSPPKYCTRKLTKRGMLPSKVWERPSFWWSPAISRSLDAGLEVSGLKKEDVDFYDLYS